MGFSFQSYLHKVQVFPADIGPRGVPSTGVSSRTGALLRALDRWRLGRWRSTAFLQPSPCGPQLCSSGWGRGVLFSSTLTPCVPWRLLWYFLALSSRSFARWYLTHWRSFAALSAGSSANGTSRTSAPPGAVDRADDIPALW